MANLGWMYLSGTGVKQDSSEAGRWFRRGAEAGDGRAMGRLGSLYFAGVGVDRNDAEAARWFNRAAAAKYSRIPKIAEELGADARRYPTTRRARLRYDAGVGALTNRRARLTIEGRQSSRVGQWRSWERA